MDLIKYTTDNLELYIDEKEGLAYATQSAIARMMGRTQGDGTIRRRLESLCHREAKIHTQYGEKSCHLYPAEVVAELAFEFNPDLAKAMTVAGANVYMLGIAGFRIGVQPEPTPEPITTQEKEALTHEQTIKLLDLQVKIQESSLPHENIQGSLYIIRELLGIDQRRLDSLPASPNPEVEGDEMIGCVQRATELGYPNNQSIKVRLGHFVSSRNPDNYPTPKDIPTENRFCNGLMLPVKVYKRTRGLDSAVHDFFEMYKGLLTT